MTVFNTAQRQAHGADIGAARAHMISGAAGESCACLQAALDRVCAAGVDDNTVEAMEAQRHMRRAVFSLAGGA